MKTLGKQIHASTADQLELLVRLDELEGWKSSGARHCVAWMNLELDIGPALGWEYLRVGRQLRCLPITLALFRSDSLGWSKVRLISRVASAENEALLCHAALDASVTEVERLCIDYRWSNYSEDDRGESLRALQQFEARSLLWSTASNGNSCIRLTVPPEMAQAFLSSVEQYLAQLEDSESSISQRRADAALLMAENSLQSAGRDIATADRYQVIVTTNASELSSRTVSKDADASTQTSTKVSTQADSQAGTQTDNQADEHHNKIPCKRPTLQGADPIARETARRIACDCRIAKVVTSDEGEPLDMGRKSRLWPASMARAIRTRDQHCQFPGCNISQHLQIHHIQHWADGGSTCVENGICLCARHHGFVHEGGYRIERINDDRQKLD